MKEYCAYSKTGPVFLHFHVSVFLYRAHCTRFLVNMLASLLTSSFFALLTFTNATPELNFAFNAQLPPVAHWGQSYTYTISSDTFISSDGTEITYEASGLPSWLQLSGRTLSGTLEDGSGDSTATFQLTATDGSGSTTSNCTLQLTDQAAPTFSASQLEAVLSSSGPVANSQSAVLTPNKEFEITFPAGFFSTDGNVIGHYAVTSGHSPLPIWLNFDGASGVFSGVAPPVNSEIAQAQNFSILYIISTFNGFESAAAQFSLLLGANVLSMNVTTDHVNATVGKELSYDVPLSEVTLNGQSIQQSDLSSAFASIPSDADSWLSFDNSTYVLSGIPPESASGDSYTVSIDIVDKYQDAVSWDVVIDVASQNNETVFSTSSLPSASATRGGWFEYSLSSYVLNQDVTLQLDGSSPSWLHLSNDNLTISGQVPGNFDSGTVSISAVELSKRAITDKDTSASAHFDIYGSGPIISSSLSASLSASTSANRSSFFSASASVSASLSASRNFSASASASASFSASISASASASASASFSASTVTATRSATRTSQSASASSSGAAVIPPVKKSSSNGVAIGCGVGIPVSLIAFAAVFLVFFCRKRRRERRDGLESGPSHGDDNDTSYISEPKPAAKGMDVTPVFRTSTSGESSLYDDALEYPDEGDDGTIGSYDAKKDDKEVEQDDESPQRASTMNFMAMDNTSQGTLAQGSDNEMLPIPEHHSEDEIANAPRESWRYTNTDGRRWQDNRLSNSSLASVRANDPPSVQLANMDYATVPRDASSGILHRVSRSSSSYSGAPSRSESKASNPSIDNEHDLTDDSGYNFKQYLDDDGQLVWRTEEEGGKATLNNVSLDRKPSKVKTPEGKKGEFVFV